VPLLALPLIFKGELEGVVLLELALFGYIKFIGDGTALVSLPLGE